MITSAVSPGDVATATQYNNMRKDAGLFSGASISFGYTAGQLTTVTHNDFSVTYTITYNSDGLIATVTDGSSTWTYTYSAGLLQSIIES